MAYAIRVSHAGESKENVHQATHLSRISEYYIIQAQV